MKFNTLRSVVSISAALALCGCAANPLVGRWTATTSGGGINGSVTLTLNGDGSAATALSLTGGTVGGMDVTCTGAGISNTGFRWTSTATTLTLSGTGTCSGMSTCMAGGMSFNFDCATSMMGGMSSGSITGDSTYTLSNNNNTLTVTSTSGGSTSMFTFMRAM